jgi:hypothetical protein
VIIQFISSYLRAQRPINNVSTSSKKENSDTFDEQNAEQINLYNNNKAQKGKINLGIN